MNSQPHPVRLSLADSGDLEIAWSDGPVRCYRVRELREACPCATCRERRAAPPPPPTSLTVLSPGDTQPLALREMKPVGNYAYSVTFSDGHDTGIFTFELLRSLGRERREEGASPPA